MTFISVNSSPLVPRRTPTLVDATGDRERYEIGDLVDEDVEPRVGDVTVVADAVHIGGVMTQRVGALLTVFGEPLHDGVAAVQLR